MDPAPPELPALPPETPQDDSLAVKAFRALLLVAGITLLWGIGSAAIFALPKEVSKAAMLALRVLLGVGIPATIVGVLAWYVKQGAHLRARGEGLDLFEDVRNPVGTTMLVRGQLNGRTVRVFRDRVEVDVVCPTPGMFEGSVLEALGRTPEGPGQPTALRAGARGLVALGVERLEVEAGRVTIHGGRALVTDLVPHALDIALSAATIRFNPAQAPSDRNCPYCHQELGPLRDEPVVRCSSCDSQHHSDCYQEHGGCAVFSCRRAPSPNRERPVRDPRIRERA